jgi:hypothetical protein
MNINLFFLNGTAHIFFILYYRDFFELFHLKCNLFKSDKNKQIQCQKFFVSHSVYYVYDQRYTFSTNSNRRFFVGCSDNKSRLPSFWSTSWLSLIISYLIYRLIYLVLSLCLFIFARTSLNHLLIFYSFTIKLEIHLSFVSHSSWHFFIVSFVVFHNIALLL